MDAPRLLPIVLAGGESLRFGRNKLAEPLAAGGVLIERPVAALRAVFGARVLLAGATDPRLISLGDGVLPDQTRGLGPIGALVSALRRASADGLTGVFVLAGDMPMVTAEVVAGVLRASAAAPHALAVVACGHDAHEAEGSLRSATDGQIHPCVGVYRLGALPPLERAVERGALRLRDALPADAVASVVFPPGVLLNVNRVADMPRGRHAAG